MFFITDLESHLDNFSKWSKVSVDAKRLDNLCCDLESMYHMRQSNNRLCKCLIFYDNKPYK